MSWPVGRSGDWRLSAFQGWIVGRRVPSGELANFRHHRVRCLLYAGPRVITMCQSAEFAWRSPPRLRRRRSCLPLDASIGETPQR